MNDPISMDFETYSKVDLRTAGLANYAADSSTGIHCLSWGTTATDIMTWVEGEPFPAELQAHLEAGGIFTAWNASFELALWNVCAVKKYGWPTLPLEQVQCSMCQAYAMSLPGALENAAPALGVAQRKDAVGKRTMLVLAQPKADGTLWRPEQDPERFAKLYEYNRQDVRTELAIRDRLLELSPSEQILWQLDQRINNTGILVDLPAIDKALLLVKSEKQRLDREILLATGGVVGSCSEVVLMLKWIRLQGVELPMRKDKDGNLKPSLAKAEVLDALSGDLPDNVRKALELRKEAAKTSTAKLVAMKARASADSRVRGIHQFHGASTGRWAGRGIQLQNYPKGRPTTKPSDVQDMVQHLGDGGYLDMLYGPVLDALSDCLRAMIIAPPGRDLVACDFSAVEARVLAWLAGEERVLKVFRTHGRIYEAAAADIYHVAPMEVTKAQRTIGKTAVLALGFGGGKGAFQAMARNFGVEFTDAEAEAIKIAWRNANPNIVSYWYALENAAIAALTEGSHHSVGPVGRAVTFKKDGSFLWCRLPSGRCLCYPYPELREVTTPWGAQKDALTYMTVVADTKGKILSDPNASGKWQRISTYGGSLAENVTQAVARDLLADAMLRFTQRGATITFHVHDEIVVEIDSHAGPETVKQIEGLMAETPVWAKDLPLEAAGWRGKFYRK